MMLAQIPVPGEDFVLVVRLVTKMNKTDYINKQLQRTDLSEKDRTNYELTLNDVLETRERQEKYIVNAFAEAFKDGQVYFIYDYQLKDWDKAKPLELKGLDGSTVLWKENLNLPFLLLASGDYSSNLLTGQSLIILDKEFRRAPHPLGMFKSIKVRGESLFSLRKTEEQWAKSLTYLKEHLYLVLSNPELSEGLQSNLLFPVDLD